MDTAREQALNDTRRTREQAEQTLAELLRAHAECEAHLAADKRSDMLRKVTGKTSLEQAIEETRRMIDVLRRAEEEALKGSSEGASLPPTAGDAPGPGPASTGTPESSQHGSHSTGLNLALAEAKPARSTGAGEEELDIAGVLRPTVPSTRSTVLFGSHTATARWSGNARR